MSVSSSLPVSKRPGTTVLRVTRTLPSVCVSVMHPLIRQERAKRGKKVVLAQNIFEITLFLPVCQPA